MRDRSILTSKWWIVGMLSLSLLFLTHCFGVYSASVTHWNSQRLELVEAQKLVAEIGSANSKPRIASTETEASEVTMRRISDSVASSGVDSDSLVSVLPYEPTRLGNSDYQQRQTEIKLQAITLPLLVRFATSLENSSAGLVVRDIAMSSSRMRSPSARELWDVTLILTQMIYSPTSR